MHADLLAMDWVEKGDASMRAAMRLCSMPTSACLEITASFMQGGISGLSFSRGCS